MFKCTSCNKSFARRDALTRHMKTACEDREMTSFKCEECGVVYSRRDNYYLRHLGQATCTEKTQPSTSDAPPVKIARMVTPSTPSTSATTTPHPRSLQHKPVLIEQLDGNVQLLKTAFLSRIATYRVCNTRPEELGISVFLDSCCNQILDLISAHVQQFVVTKTNLELFAGYYLQSKDICEIKSFNTKNAVFNTVNSSEELEKLFDSITKKASEFAEKESGWTLVEILFVEVNINKYSPLKGFSYVQLPADIRQKKAVLNIQNNDSACFKWCILAHLHPFDRTKAPERVHHYHQYESELDFTGIDFPVKLHDIPTFEKLNNISVNVFGLDTVFNSETNKHKSTVIGPFYHTPEKRAVHVNLLLVTDDLTSTHHYCLIRNLSRLVRSQQTLYQHSVFICDGCLLTFPSEERLAAHNQFDCNKVVTRLPSTEEVLDKFGKKVPGNELKFQNFERSMRVPFVIYFDFESVLKPIAGCEPPSLNASGAERSYTQATHLHVPHSFAYYIKCSYDDSLSIYRTYRGDDAPKKFVERLEADCKRIYKQHLKPIVPIKMSEAEELSFQVETRCHLCKETFASTDTKVRNHDHLTGAYLGSAHSNCNLNYKIPQFIPAICHNLSGYDTHLFIKDLAEEDADISVIAQNKERYVSFTKKVLVDHITNKKKKEKNVFLKLRFIDSYRFMASSLDKLAQNLSSEDCHNVRKHFPDDAKFKLIRQKGVFPYVYVDSFEKLNDTQLPTREQFNDNLKKEEISKSDYQRAIEVWKLFGCRTLGEYSDIYLKSDVLLLADVFESFRDVCLKNYDLDPAQYLTAPALTWDAMLKSTGVKLELLTDIDMLHFFRKSIRGGTCFCSQRRAVANNKYMPEYSPNTPNSYLLYLDATNLYGAAMSAYLPHRNFKWQNPEKFDVDTIMGLSDTADEGCIFEVDLEYPKELHDLHNDMPFCPENIVPPGGKTKKLCTTFFNKTQYIIHYQNLKQALSHGLKLTKIHRVLSFDQAPWLKRYIDLNTALRNKARNSFEKNFFKLMNNSVFGKTMESVDKRVDVRLVTSWETTNRNKIGARSLIARPNYKNCSIFTENFVAIQMQKSSILYDKPIYAGFSILDLSKTIMYRFYYDHIKTKYADNASLLYTDTDSLVLQVYCDDFYADMKDDINEFDTSNYALDNPYGIPKTPSVLGKMKDEYAGRIIWEFVGTGAKAYCVDVEGELTKKAKGIKKNVVDRELELADYFKAVSKPGNEILRTMSVFRSVLHNIYTKLERKVALSFHDDKRYLIPGTYRTLSWGHKNIPPPTSPPP